MADIERVTTESARVVPVIETKSTRGAGTSANPVRLVTQYWSLDGELLAEKDEFMREKLSQQLSDNNDRIPEIKQTKWIADKCLGRINFRCPKCQSNANYFVGGTEDWWDVEKPNFCPNCGIKLK